MVPTLLATGVISLAQASGSGNFDVAEGRVATAALVQGDASFSGAIPYGAYEWPVAYDPGDHRPYGFSFDDVLDAGDSITSIVRIAMSPQAAALGVQVDQATGFAPFIDGDTKRKLQLWFVVADGSQELGSFDAGGVQLPVAFRVLTAKNHRVERSGVLTVRQQ